MTGRIKADEFNRIFDREVKKYEENLAKDKFVVYPDPQFTMEELIQHKQMSDENVQPKTDELNVSSILTPEELAKFSPEPETNGEGAIDVADDDTDDLNKKTYLKITSTFYIKPISEKNAEGKDMKFYKILNPETNVVEKRQLTDIENHDIIVHDLKESKVKFHPIKHFAVKTTMVLTEDLDVLGRKKKRKDTTILTNVTTNKFGKAYHDKRKRKNKMQKASRKANR